MFVYAADAKIVDTDIRFLEGCLVPEGMGWTPSQYMGIGLTELLNDLRTPYRKVYVVFENYRYVLKRKNGFKVYDGIPFQVEHYMKVSDRAAAYFK